MGSPEITKSAPTLLTPNEARAVVPAVPEPDKLALEELKASHARATQKAEQGWVGRALGSRGEKPGNVAAVVIVLCFALLFWAFYNIRLSGEISDSFFKLLSALSAVIGLALGYLFGSTNKG